MNPQVLFIDSPVDEKKIVPTLWILAEGFIEWLKKYTGVGYYFSRWSSTRPVLWKGW